MSYEKKEWQTGEVITAEKLNHIENGINSNIFIVNVVSEEETGVKATNETMLRVTPATTTVKLDKTWQEIQDAIEDGKIVITMRIDNLQKNYSYKFGQLLHANKLWDEENNKFSYEVVAAVGADSPYLFASFSPQQPLIKQ